MSQRARFVYTTMFPRSDAVAPDVQKMDLQRTALCAPIRAREKSRPIGYLRSAWRSPMTPRAMW